MFLVTMKNRLVLVQLLLKLVVLLGLIGKTEAKNRESRHLHRGRGGGSSHAGGRGGYGLLDECTLYKISEDLLTEMKTIFKPSVYCPPIRQICYYTTTFISSIYCAPLTSCAPECEEYLTSNCLSTVICSV